MYLNDSNPKLMIANRILREDLEEIDTSYQELITVSKEALRRKRVTKKQYEEIVNQTKIFRIEFKLWWQSSPD